MSVFTMAAHTSPFVYQMAAQPPPPRQFSNQATSSAFSSSANPDEDWTKISDLAERRRIQNRIAQRNYRKKLKRRLEDLERRAGTSDGAPTSNVPTASGRAHPGVSKAAKHKAGGSKAKSATPEPMQPMQPVQPVQPMQSMQQLKPAMPHGQFTPPMQSADELFFHQGLERHTSPSSLYSDYPHPDEILPPYQTMSAAESYPGYLTAPVTVTLPPMAQFSEIGKRDPYQSDGAFAHYLDDYDMGIDVNVANTYSQPDPHTPPLTGSYDHSANCSDSGCEYPATPLSLPPGSPGMMTTRQ